MSSHRVRRIIAALGMAALMVGMFVGYAVAGGDAFDCNGCIDKRDIGAGAAGTSEIQNGSVGITDLSTAVKRRAGLLTVSAVTNTSGDVQDIAAFRITAPAAGRMLINVAGVSYVERDAGADEEINTEVVLALCKQPDTTAHASCGDQNADVQYLYYADYDNESPTNETESISFWRSMSVSKGVNTFYLNADVDGPYEFDLGGCCGGANIAAFFTPNSLPMNSL